MDILDLGCGWGSLCLFLAEVSFQYHCNEAALSSDGSGRDTQIRKSQRSRILPLRRSISILKGLLISLYTRGTSENMTSRPIFG